MHRCTGLSMAVPLLQAETLEVPSEAQTQHTADTLKICASTRFGQCFSESKFFKQNSTTVTIFKKKITSLQNIPSMLNQSFCISTKK